MIHDANCSIRTLEPTNSPKPTKKMNRTKYQNTMILSMLAIGLLVNLSQAQGNRYGFNEKETADSTNLENSRQIIAPNKTAQPQGEFWQRFRADLKTTGQQLGKAFNRAREELSYSYRTSTTKFPKNNNLNRHLSLIHI